MDQHLSHSSLDLERSLRRSRGRAGRTRSATARVTRDEQNEMEAAAASQGLSLSEWCRETLLGAARGQAVTPEFTEVVAMRVLLNTVLSKLACGETMTREAFNKEMHSIRTNKRKAAEEVMQQYTEKEATR